MKLKNILASLGFFRSPFMKSASYEKGTFLREDTHPFECRLSVVRYEHFDDVNIRKLFVRNCWFYFNLSCSCFFIFVSVFVLFFFVFFSFCFFFFFCCFFLCSRVFLFFFVSYFIKTYDLFLKQDIIYLTSQFYETS